MGDDRRAYHESRTNKAGEGLQYMRQAHEPFPQHTSTSSTTFGRVGSLRRPLSRSATFLLVPLLRAIRLVLDHILKITAGYPPQYAGVDDAIEILSRGQIGGKGVGILIEAGAFGLVCARRAIHASSRCPCMKMIEAEEERKKQQLYTSVHSIIKNKDVLHLL